MALTFRHTVEFSKNKHTPSQTTEAAVESGVTHSDLPGPVLINPERFLYEPGDSSSLAAVRVDLPTALA
jgi:hypothetical protein